METLNDHLLPVLMQTGNGIRDMIGLRGAQAVFRQAGRDMAKQINTNHNGDKIPLDAAQQTAAEILMQLGLFESIDLMNGCAHLHHCILGQHLERVGEKPGEHPLCFLGFGLIEGIVQRTSDEQVRIRLEQRDPTGGVCVEPWNDGIR